MNKIRYLILIFTTNSWYLLAEGQTGISISPPRVYYVIGPGQSQTEKVLVANPSKDYTLDLAVTFEDWEYDSYGNNVMYEPGKLPTSCAAWLTVPEAYFSLAPGESKEIDVQMTVPAANQDVAVPVHTAVLYVTQLNPREGVDHEGANIRIAVRTGIKLYQRQPGKYNPVLEITNFRYEKKEAASLVLHFDNIGDVWGDGRISLELLNQSTGTKRILPDVLFYSMPGDKRQHYLELPADLEVGHYIATAIINYGDANTVKIAELEFSHEI
ncbi:fimbrial biogenesis chaperone [Parapedobacter koreensis]|uniref:P pilus assembly protein, chaperone PapD n=1 Tax=Parapedobacter koreensis TaxID=332977 RepID=A0A1H7STN9_9SPHI|nr:hypothetical protein [Parapedobacter koreensis]SEL75755.1 hypothetical protein SAMN05421740_109182 [Parapedobacter koreensis]